MTLLDAIVQGFGFAAGVALFIGALGFAFVGIVRTTRDR